MKAVIPAAGFGTRFLPLTKAQPKEMLPVVNKPTIQWVVEEAVDAGITDIAIITGKHKKSIANHFSSFDRLEEELKRSEKVQELEQMRKINNLANLTFIIQEKQKGLGHAILCAEDFVGDNPFAVLLGDTICTGNPNCTKSLVNLFHKKKSNIFSVEKVKLEETKRYGIVSGEKIGNDLMNVEYLIEKPGPDKAPSLLGIQGRYVFTSDLFDHLKNSQNSIDGHIQLTEAMNSLCKVKEMYCWKFSGKRYDIGTMRDWFQSHLELSARSEFKDIVDEVVKGL